MSISNQNHNKITNSYSFIGHGWILYSKKIKKYPYYY